MRSSSNLSGFNVVHILAHSAALRCHSIEGLVMHRLRNFLAACAVFLSGCAADRYASNATPYQNPALPIFGPSILEPGPSIDDTVTDQKTRMPSKTFSSLIALGRAEPRPSMSLSLHIAQGNARRVAGKKGPAKL